MRLKLKVPIEALDEEIEVEFWSFFKFYFLCGVIFSLGYLLAGLILYGIGYMLG